MRGKTRTISNNDKQGGAHKLYKFKSTCIDDATSAWTESYYDESFTYDVNRKITVSGFVSNGEGFANSHCAGGVGPCPRPIPITPAIA